MKITKINIKTFIVLTFFLFSFNTYLKFIGYKVEMTKIETGPDKEDEEKDNKSDPRTEEDIIKTLKDSWYEETDVNTPTEN